MRFSVVLTARASSDLQLARDFLRTFAPETAERWYLRFLEALTALEQNPESGRLLRSREIFRSTFGNSYSVREAAGRSELFSRSFATKFASWQYAAQASR